MYARMTTERGKEDGGWRMGLVKGGRQGEGDKSACLVCSLVVTIERGEGKERRESTGRTAKEKKEKGG